MWYDWFAKFYDQALEKRYLSTRTTTVAALQVPPGSLVLDVACGTGQNFPLLQEALGSGTIVGVDPSSGMLQRARERTEKAGWTNVHLIEADIHDFDASHLEACCGRTAVDGVICTLGMTVIPDWQEAFRKMYALLREGGRMVLFDAYAERWVVQTMLSGLVARADLSRRFWEPLEAVADDFNRVKLPGSPHEFGGHLFLASGTKR